MSGLGLVGVGIDVVDLERFRTVINRTPSMVERIFTDAEREYSLRLPDPTERLAVRFAAKEAVMKAMGVGLGSCTLAHIEVVRSEEGQPSVVLHETAERVAEAAGVGGWRLSLTHSGSMAQAIALALGPALGTDTSVPRDIAVAPSTTATPPRP